MFRKIRQTILQLREAAGIEISLFPEEQVSINGVCLRIERGKVVKRSEFQSLHSYEELIKKISTKVPVAVIIHGRGVLQKKVKRTAEAAVGNPGGAAGSAAAGMGGVIGSAAAGMAPEQVFEEALPNANPNEFFLEIASFEHFSWVSIIRKDLLEKILQRLQALGFRVLSVSIGPGSIESIASFINFDKERIAGNEHFEMMIDQQQKVADIVVTPAVKASADPKTEYNIGDQYVFASSLFAFSAATGLLSYGMSGSTSIENALVARERDEYTHFRYFVAGRWALMIVVFVVLLVNFFFYTYYFNRNAELRTSLESFRQQSGDFQRLQAAIGSRQVFFESNGWNRSARLSFYADRIAGLVPSGALLTSLRINPLNNGLFSDGSGAVFKRDTIQIAGTCDDPTELNRWVNNLRDIDQFRTVSLVNYSYKKETGTGTFLMEITTR